MTKYPLMDNAPEALQAASGRSVADIKLEAIEDLTSDDFQISPETLRAQAEIAREGGLYTTRGQSDPRRRTHRCSQQ